MYELWKGRKARAACTAYRGILLSDDSSKAYHSDLRRGGDQYLAKYAFEEQFGGIPGRGCDLAVMYMRMMAEYTRQQSLCHSDILVDAVAAFYSVMRALAIPGVRSDESVAFLAKHVALGAEVMEELYAAIAETAFDDAAVPDELSLLISESHSCTWFGIDGSSSYVMTTRGTMPGYPFGDFVFNFLMRKILARCRAQLLAQELTHAVPWNGIRSIVITGTRSSSGGSSAVVGSGLSSGSGSCMVDLNPCTFVDDSALPVVSETASQHEARTLAAIVIIDVTFRAHCLRLDWGSGKWEVIVRFRGRGSVQVARLFAAGGSAGFDVIMKGDSQTTRVHAVRQYRHLGAVHTDDGSFGPEVMARLASTRQAHRPLRSRVFTSRRYEASTRVSLVASLLWSLLYLSV